MSAPNAEQQISSAYMDAAERSVKSLVQGAHDLLQRAEEDWGAMTPEWDFDLICEARYRCQQYLGITDEELPGSITDAPHSPSQDTQTPGQTEQEDSSQ